MILRNFISIRALSTTRYLFKSLLSENYKSQNLWDERLKCPNLSTNKNLINSIEDKMMLGSELNNVELDVFINIATPIKEDVAQLRESIKLLNKLRRSVYANTLLPSTHHALCRLFLNSQCLPSLVHVLENRIDYGIFPDLYALNMLLDECLDKDNLVLASKLSSLVMLQEEFGINPITDGLVVLSCFKYIMSKTDFSDWQQHDFTNDKVFANDSLDTEEIQDKGNLAETNNNEEKVKDDDDEEEEEAEYIRVPFLRNPYEDGHFDLKNPRLICGKTLRLAGISISSQNEYTGIIASLLGSILEGEWSKVSSSLQVLVHSDRKLPKGFKDIANYYIDNLHDITPESEENKQSMKSILDSSLEGDSSLIDEVESYVKDQVQTHEHRDMDELRKLFKQSSDLRFHYQKLREDIEMRKKLAAEIETKKQELKAKEQYLYFYDNLKKSTLTKIEYK